MKPSLRLQLERLSLRLGELEALLADPAVASNMTRYRELGREHAEAHALVDLFRRYEGRERERDAADELLRESTGDPDMAGMAEEEIQAAAAELSRLDAELQTGVAAARSGRLAQRLPRGARRHRRRRVGPVRRRTRPDVPALRRTPGLALRGHVGERERPRRLQGARPAHRR
jgi:hypothetical protein